jgi:hypothetical protein
MTRVVSAVLVVAALQGFSPASQHPASQRPASQPCLYWPHAAADTAADVKAAGIQRLCVPPDRAAEWKTAGFDAVPAQFGARARARVPGITSKPQLLSATRTPWVDSNGWRFIRDPAGAYAYELPAGKAPLAAAEAFAYGVDALLHVDRADLSELGKMFAFQASLPRAQLAALADFGFVDDGSDIAAEVMNLLVRRNLLFQALKAPSAQFKINVVLGQAGYSREEALDNPSAFALKVRQQLTDERRTLRIYGTEVVIGRLAGDSRRARLHLLNYGGRQLEGLRIRLRGTYRDGVLHLPGAPQSTLSDYAVADGATEFSVPRITMYAVIDLTAAR